MTEPTPAHPRTVPRRRRSLHRTVLSLAVAAVVAAWLPFSVFYFGALAKPPAISTVAVKNGHPVVITRTSSGQLVRGTAPSATAPSASLLPVTTHVS